MLFKRIIFFAIMVFLTVLITGCSTPVIDEPIVTPEIITTPPHIPDLNSDSEIEPNPLSTPSPDNNWAELFATIHTDMTSSDLNELFGVYGMPREGGRIEWTHEDGTEIMATFLPEFNSAFLTAHPSLFYNPDTKFDVERIMEFENSEYVDIDNRRHPAILSSVWEYEAGDIFYDDIAEMCGRVSGIPIVWWNPDNFDDIFGDGFDTFVWTDGEYILYVRFRDEDKSLKFFEFYPFSSYPLLYDEDGYPMP